MNVIHGSVCDGGVCGGGGGLCERAHGVPYYPCGVMSKASGMLAIGESWKDPHPLVHSL
jgi:hypothetical protein